ncbi:MAG: protein-export chaperone SecB [Bacteroidia bacterium]|nr:protein-export chaperone SecB [Bacteroidia bacterium]
MKKAEFKLDTYKFTRASIDFTIPNGAELCVSFHPHGLFHKKECRYELYFDVEVVSKETNTRVASVSCAACFSFVENSIQGDIPEFFYPNSLAIIFPYIRAFISTISLQANIQPIMLPTINLMGLTEELKSRTEVID